MRIGGRIAAFREDLGMSQEVLASRVSRLSGRDISRGVLGQYEIGAVEPPATRLMDLAQALGCTVSDLTGDERSEEADTAFYDEDWTPAERQAARRAAKAYVRAWREERGTNGA